ncbi:MAG: hypothetical protein JNM81_07530 [Rhodospirillaceae bacterium]|nr:hypothetical protein [Rhodospirillaceae bacterium]
MDRRTLVAGVPVASALAAFGVSQAQAADRPAAVAASAPEIKFPAAVMRVPVNVPPSAGELENVRKKNLAAMVEAIEGVMRANATAKPRIVNFPVLQLTSAQRSVSGVPMSAVAVDLVSKPLDKTVFAPVIEACRRHNCYVATSTQEMVPQMPGRYFHTGVVMGPEGLVLRSPKSQAQSAPEVSYLRDIADEYTKIFGPDSILPVVKTPIGNLACYVEGEAEVLEVSRLVAAKGAEIILHVSLENEETPWMALKQAIAFQCHVYLITGATSRTLYANNPEGKWAGGASTIIGPSGKVLAQKGGQDEGFAVAEIDIGAIAEAKKKYGRNTVPAWNLYTNLYKG